MKKILGISAFYHDSAAALIIDGKPISAAQEERFTRKKHDASFPSNAVSHVLSDAGLSISELDAVAFYDKPFIKFERLLETYHAFAPRGLKSFLSAMPVWIKEKLFMRKTIWTKLKTIEGNPLKKRPPLLFPEHHLSHAASAFYPSPFDESAILTIDGVGEWATTTICHGKKGSITKLREMPFPHSIGLLYSSFTAFCGFKVNSGEYKLMGLAPYGVPDSDEKNHFKELILTHLVEMKPDGSIFLNMQFFEFATGLTMFKSSRWQKLFGFPPRDPESEIHQSYMNLALALQEITEELVLCLAQTAKDITGSSSLVMAGGVALNCVANGRLLESGIFDKVWIQPAAGDAGGSLGAALAAHHIYFEQKRQPILREDTMLAIDNMACMDKMNGCLLGPGFSNKDIHKLKHRYEAVFTEFADSNFPDLCHHVANLISEDKIVGWFQGRMEWGPRALGNRSILGNPQNPDTQRKMNLKIKYREGFRPFAPSILAEHAQTFFKLNVPSPYMLLVAPVCEEKRCQEPDKYQQWDMYKRLYHVRSIIPAVTHVDYSARIQTVHKDFNPRYWQLIDAFYQLTGIPLVVNTSFNVRGEPIVCTPEDAYRCFMGTEMDYLIMENCIFAKKDQPAWNGEAPLHDKLDLD
ncbi:MAG: carbamoyltransferase [Desulfamplus sp.]|nr:carbamoyltransferase [Desulfamplus sp.]